MRKLKSAWLPFLVANFLTQTALGAQDEVLALVEAVGVNSSDVIFFNIDSPVAIDSCMGKQIVIPPHSAFRDRILSIVLAAKASGAKIVVKVSGCYQGAPTIENGKPGWVYIK
jgi:hypothetical protein